MKALQATETNIQGRRDKFSIRISIYSMLENEDRSCVLKEHQTDGEQHKL